MQQNKMVSKSPVPPRNSSISKKERTADVNVVFIKVETDKLLRNIDICSRKVDFKDELKDIDTKKLRATAINDL